ncbi:MAG: phosphoglycerate kinase [Patescibacteria group bacterium]
MKTVKDIQHFEGVKVLLRLDLNVPIKNGKVVDDFRIQKSLPLLHMLTEKGAKVIIIAHIETVGDPTLEPIVASIRSFGINCEFVKNYKHVNSLIENSPNGSVILLENLRAHEGEMKNDPDFAKELASLGDIYINEAFSVSHRAHASISAVTKFLPSYAGLQFEEEVKNLSSAFDPLHPFLFILGGAKFETKLPLIEKFMEIADKVFVGGALANNFFKEEGKDIGKSLVSAENFNLSRFLGSPKLLLPIDTIVEDNTIFDAGEQTLLLLKEEALKAKYILWNGPLGAYEQGYKKPTLELAKIVAEATQNGARTILGGGDTLGAISELGLLDKYTFVSTGGGAMLDYLAKGTLPGIEALEKGMK